MNDVITQSMNLLGTSGKDIISGFEGVVSSVSFDLYGCVSIVLTPPVDKDGKTREGHWFDVKRFQSDGKRVMEVPAFAKTPMGSEIGAADKPLPPR